MNYIVPSYPKQAPIAFPPSPPRPSAPIRAQAEADAIVAYWAARGHKIEAWIEQVETKLGLIHIVRTNLINGLPSSRIINRLAWAHV